MPGRSRLWQRRSLVWRVGCGNVYELHRLPFQAFELTLRVRVSIKYSTQSFTILQTHEHNTLAQPLQTLSKADIPQSL